MPSTRVEDLRDDLQPLVMAMHPKDAKEFLKEYERDLGRLVSELDPGERIVAACPSNVELLLVTTERFLSNGYGGKAELFLEDLTPSQVEFTPGWTFSPASLKVFTDAAGSRYMSYSITNRDESSGPFMKTFLEEIRKARQKPARASVEPQVSIADEIRKLGDLKSEGLITEEEFEAKKKNLLA